MDSSLIRIVGEDDTPLRLASGDPRLGLQDDGDAEIRGNLPRGGGTGRDPASGDGNAMLTEERFTLIFMESGQYVPRMRC